MRDRSFSPLFGGPSLAFVEMPIMMSSTAGMLPRADSAIVSAMNAFNANVKPSSQMGFFYQIQGGQRIEGETDTVPLRPPVTFGDTDPTMDFLVGFDKKVGASITVGSTVRYLHAMVNSEASLSLDEKAKKDSMHASLYGTYTHDDFYLNGILGYGHNHYDTKRHINFGLVDNTSTASYKAYLTSSYVETGYKLPISFVDIIPNAAIQGNYLIRDGFTESESFKDGLALNAARENLFSLQSSLGLRFKKDIDFGSGAITSEIKFRWDHEFANGQGFKTALTRYIDNPYTIDYGIKDHDRFVASFSLVYKEPGKRSYYLSADSKLAPNGTVIYTGALGMTYSF